MNKDPNFSYLHATKGLFHFRRADITKGVKFYQKAIDLRGEDLALKRKFHFEYGMALRVAKKFDEAIEQLEKALEIGSTYIYKGQIEVEIDKAKREDNSIYYS